jgi:hypothetical protein
LTDNVTASRAGPTPTTAAATGDAPETTPGTGVDAEWRCTDAITVAATAAITTTATAATDLVASISWTPT